LPYEPTEDSDHVVPLFGDFAYCLSTAVNTTPK
jgi:hypothetical protein